MEPRLDELAEHTEVHLLPRATFDSVERDGLVYLAGLRSANVHPYRVDDVEAQVRWSRAESGRRGHKEVEWWVGWRAEPNDLGNTLAALGLVPNDDPPTLTGMTCTTEPPRGTVEVSQVETLGEYTAALQVDWEVWQLNEDERDSRRELEIGRFDEMQAAGTVHHFAALLDGRLVGFARAIDMPDAVALFGGAVLPDARRKGVYRSLVHARWAHAAARETPVLVVQAGPMSAPVLDGLGFRRHGEIRLYLDQL
jgi:GNAT superfamily N-acetyltransferase